MVKEHFLQFINSSFLSFYWFFLHNFDHDPFPFLRRIHVRTMSSLLKGAKTYVDGQWVGAASGETFEVKNPSTGEVLASVPNMNAGDTNVAIEAARKVKKRPIFKL